jgi:hypothetical protein
MANIMHCLPACLGRPSVSAPSPTQQGDARAQNTAGTTSAG